MSFRGDAKHRTPMCNCTSENLEIPRCAIAHLRSGPEPVIGRRAAPTRWDHPGMTNIGRSLQICLGQPRFCGRCIVAGFGLYLGSISKKSEEQRHVPDRCCTHFATLRVLAARPPEGSVAAARP